MAERLSMGDGNRTCTNKVAVGWTNLVGENVFKDKLCQTVVWLVVKFFIGEK